VPYTVESGRSSLPRRYELVNVRHDGRQAMCSDHQGIRGSRAGVNVSFFPIFVQHVSIMIAMPLSRSSDALGIPLYGIQHYVHIPSRPSHKQKMPPDP
jgi:hypothetical protein